MAGIETVPVAIPGVEIVGEFPIRRFMEAVYNGMAKSHGVKLSVTVLPPAENERAAGRIRKGAGQ